LQPLLSCAARVTHISINAGAFETTLRDIETLLPTIQLYELTLAYLAFDAGGLASTVSGGTSGALFVHIHIVLNFCAPPA
jgi:hypothetical protein